MSDESPRILRNRCRCTRCGDVIESQHRHDFQRCKCGTIFADGGTTYVRRGYSLESDIEDLTEYAETGERIGLTGNGQAALDGSERE